MKPSNVWHGHSTRPSLPAGTARKVSGSLPHGRRNRPIMQTTKNRKFPPVGNSLLYISLLSVAFGRVRPQGAPCFLFYINGLVRCVSRSVVTCDPAKHNKVAHGIAANAVAAMHTAGSFASGIQTGNDISLRIKNLCVCVDLQTAHSVMDSSS